MNRSHILQSSFHRCKLPNKRSRIASFIRSCPLFNRKLLCSLCSTCLAFPFSIMIVLFWLRMFERLTACFRNRTLQCCHFPRQKYSQASGFHVSGCLNADMQGRLWSVWSILWSPPPKAVKISQLFILESFRPKYWWQYKASFYCCLHAGKL